jgi:ribonuclease D
VFDTMIAARLTGCLRFGLSDLVGEFLGVTLEKGPQKADWARRPLSERMIEYALNDSRYLRPLVLILEEKLRAAGRLEWVEESCARLVTDCSKPSVPDQDLIWRIKGSFRLPPRALAVLRELWRWREHEAVAANRPPFFILSHETLVALAETAVAGGPVSDLMPQRISPRRRGSLEEALERGLAVPPADWPKLHRSIPYHPTQAEKKRFEELKVHRDQRAAELQLDPTLIANRFTLESIARDGKVVPAELMSWQRKLLGL